MRTFLSLNLQNRVSRNEYGLRPGLDRLLETLSSILYDLCRPLIIREAGDIDTLVELASVLKIEALGGGASQPDTAAFACVAEQLLEDVQQQLAYRAQTFCGPAVPAGRPMSCKKLIWKATKRRAVSEASKVWMARSAREAAWGGAVARRNGFFCSTPRTLRANISRRNG